MSVILPSVINPDLGGSESSIVATRSVAFKTRKVAVPKAGNHGRNRGFGGWWYHQFGGTGNQYPPHRHGGRTYRPKSISIQRVSIPAARQHRPAEHRKRRRPSLQSTR